MPSIYTFMGYKIYVWSNEGQGVSLEPIHVHVAHTPSSRATKFWITSSGEVILANNDSNLSPKELRKIKESIETNIDDIKDEWIFRHHTITYIK